MKSNKIALFLCFILLLSVLASCVDIGSDNSSAESAAVSDAVSEPETGYTYSTIRLEPPSGFTKEIENGQNLLLVLESYPTVTDNINFNVIDYTGKMKDFSSVTESYMLSSVQAEIPGVEKFDFFEKREINGLKCLVFSYDFTYENVFMRQIICQVLSGDKIVTVTFTSVSGDYYDDFISSVETIKAK